MIKLYIYNLFLFYYLVLTMPPCNVPKCRICRVGRSDCCDMCQVGYLPAIDDLCTCDSGKLYHYIYNYQTPLVIWRV